MDTHWAVELRRSADAELDALSRNLQEAALEAIPSLQEDPFPPDHVKMEGYNDLYRLRLDGWRIVYRVNTRRRIVRVERIRARGVAYKGL